MPTIDRTIRLPDERSHSEPPAFFLENPLETIQQTIYSSFGNLFYHRFAIENQGSIVKREYPPGPDMKYWVLRQNYRESGALEGQDKLEVSASIYNTVSETLSAWYNPQYNVHSVFDNFGYHTAVIGPESRIVKNTLATAQGYQEWELSQQYGELGAALRDLAAFEEEDDWKIESSVYNVASYFATELRSNLVPAPQVFVHGPKSVVFNWSDGFYNLYLTIGASNVSALLSSPERIIRRAEYSKNELRHPIALLYFGSENPALLSNNQASDLPESFR